MTPEASANDSLPPARPSLKDPQVVELINEFSDELGDLEPQDAAFVRSLPPFMRPPSHAPPREGPVFHPEGFLETRAKSIGTPAPPDNISEAQWRNWQGPRDSIQDPTLPPPPVVSSQNDPEAERWLQLDDERRWINEGPARAHRAQDEQLVAVHRNDVEFRSFRPPSPPRPARHSNAIQTDFPGATIIIVPPGGGMPQFMQQATPFSSQFSAQFPAAGPSIQYIQAPAVPQFGPTVVQVPMQSTPFQQFQQFSPPHMSASFPYPPTQWGPYNNAFHPWR